MSARLVLAPLLAPLLVAFGGAALFAFSGCEAAPLKLCGEIPAGGCPIGRGGTCADAVCAGLYDCVEGKWTEVEMCSEGAGDGGPSGDGDGGGGEAGADGSCLPVTINHEGEVAGCAPYLQHPDCPAAAAEGCAATVCLTGCLDFFLCIQDVWTEVAYCSDQGNIVVIAK